MALIKEIAEVKAVLRVSNMDDNAALPDMDAAGEKYIVPVLGQELYDGMQNGYDNDSLTDLEKSLLKKIQKPLSAFAYYDDLAALHLRISDAGVRRTTTSNEPSAFKWEFEAAKEFLTNRGFQGIESLYAFLEKNIEDFGDWEESDAYQRRNKFMIKNGNDFSDQFNLYQPLRTYAALFGVMSHVEENYINASIGKGFFNSLKEISTPGAAEREAIEFLKKAIANYTVSHACKKLPVRISDAGFTVIMATAGDNADSQRQQAGNNQLDLLMNSCQSDGDLYMNKLRTYLDKTASDAVFPQYKNSEFYTAAAPPVDLLKRNDDRKNLYL